jgi:hypothetical protein
MTNLIPVFKGDHTIEPMPWSMKGHLDRLLDDERRVSVDRDIGMVSVDGEILGKRRRNK